MTTTTTDRKTKRGKREQRDAPVSAMGRIEAAAQQADPQPAAPHGRVWPEPRTCHL
mgnify:CR=1 FL=1